jgi:hypothetical protein
VPRNRLLELVALAALFCHLGAVNAAAIPTALAPAPPARNPLSLERFLTAWIEAVNDYLQRQYREIIQQRPSPETLAQYKTECKWLLRSALKLDSMVKDPEYPARPFGPDIAGKLLQLQQSWESLNNPMTEAEADAILQQVFPDEPRTGSPAQSLG